MYIYVYIYILIIIHTRIHIHIYTHIGGGLSGQSQAVRHGLATALRYMVPDLRKQLKDQGYLMRDPRRVERKKPGRLKARKKKTWVKR